MGKEEFKAMVALIEKMIGLHDKLSDHPNDKPRIEALWEERQQALIEAAREVIDEPYEEEEIIDQAAS